MSQFRIKKKIVFNPRDFENEVYAINAARDFATKEYQTEIQKGKIILFEDWHYEEGFINFEIGDR